MPYPDSGKTAPKPEHEKIKITPKGLEAEGEKIPFVPLALIGLAIILVWVFGGIATNPNNFTNERFLINAVIIFCFIVLIVVLAFLFKKNI